MNSTTKAIVLGLVVLGAIVLIVGLNRRETTTIIEPAPEPTVIEEVNVEVVEPVNTEVLPTVN